MLSRLALVASGTSVASLISDFCSALSTGENDSLNASPVARKYGQIIHQAVDKNKAWCRSVLSHSSTVLTGRSLWNVNCSSCEKEKETLENPATEEEDSFPNFSRHGPESLLPKYLTREVYEKLKDRKTSRGVTLDDTIRAGVALPWGANPSRGIAGVYAGDAESYETFRSLFDPLIVERHHVDAQRKFTRNQSRGVPGQKTLQRHRTNLNPQFLLQQRLDPEGEYVLYTRMRLARSLEGFRFSPSITRSERRKVEQILRDCCDDWKEGSYIPVMEMSNEMHDDLIQRRILFPDPDEFALVAGTHRDWPDGRGLYCNTWDGLPSVSLWVNFEDHVSIGMCRLVNCVCLVCFECTVLYSHLESYDTSINGQGWKRPARFLATLSGRLGLGNIASGSRSEICRRSSLRVPQCITYEYWYSTARQCLC